MKGGLAAPTQATEPGVSAQALGLTEPTTKPLLTALSSAEK